MDELAGAAGGAWGFHLYVQHVKIFTTRNLGHYDNRSIKSYTNTKLAIDNLNGGVYNSLNKSPCYIYR